MKFTGKERKMYVLALALLVAAIALACTWTMWERPSSQTSQSAGTPTPAPSETPAPEETLLLVETPAPEESAAPAQSASEAEAGMVNTVVYYQDNYGYLVPVMCRVPAEDGIAKATLSRMVKSTANDMQAARLGLRTVLPENISIDLDIAGGLARIDHGRRGAFPARRRGGKQHDHRHRTGADGISHRGEGGISHRRPADGNAAARHRRLRPVHPGRPQS